MTIDDFIEKYGIEGPYLLINQLSNAQSDDELRHVGYELSNDLLSLLKSYSENIKLNEEAIKRARDKAIEDVNSFIKRANNSASRCDKYAISDLSSAWIRLEKRRGILLGEEISKFQDELIEIENKFLETCVCNFNVKIEAR